MIAVVVGSGDRPVVYLAGGLKSGWQDEFLCYKDFRWVDPRALNSPGHAVEDVAFIERSVLQDVDGVIACYEGDDFCPHGMATEIGYAAALGKPLVMYIPEQAQVHELTTTLRWWSEFCRMQVLSYGITYGGSAASEADAISAMDKLLDGDWS